VAQSDSEKSPSPESPARVLVATGNMGKLREIAEILSDTSFSYCSLDEFPALSFPEEGEDYASNAVAKARTAASGTGMLALADDSGLEVEALSWAPGPLSARYGGSGLDDPGRVRKLLEALRGVSEERRNARFVCVAALVTPDGHWLVRRGECIGRILERPQGEGGFGYDPVFEPTGYSESMGLLSREIKNRISHRARAFRALISPLREALAGRLESFEKS